MGKKKKATARQRKAQKAKQNNKRKKKKVSKRRSSSKQAATQSIENFLASNPDSLGDAPRAEAVASDQIHTRQFFAGNADIETAAGFKALSPEEAKTVYTQVLIPEYPEGTPPPTLGKLTPYIELGALYWEAAHRHQDQSLELEMITDILDLTQTIYQDSLAGAQRFFAMMVWRFAYLFPCDLQVQETPLPHYVTRKTNEENITLYDENLKVPAHAPSEADKEAACQALEDFHNKKPHNLGFAECAQASAVLANRLIESFRSWASPIDHQETEAMLNHLLIMIYQQNYLDMTCLGDLNSDRLYAFLVEQQVTMVGIHPEDLATVLCVLPCFVEFLHHVGVLDRPSEITDAVSDAQTFLRDTITIGMFEE